MGCGYYHVYEVLLITIMSFSSFSQDGKSKNEQEEVNGTQSVSLLARKLPLNDKYIYMDYGMLCSMLPVMERRLPVFAKEQIATLFVQNVVDKPH